MVVQAEQERMRVLLIEAVTCLCRNAMKFNRSLCVQGLLGITLDEKDVILVDIKETLNQSTVLTEKDANWTPESNGSVRPEGICRFSTSQKTYSSPVKRTHQPAPENEPSPKRQSLEPIQPKPVISRAVVMASMKEDIQEAQICKEEPQEEEPDVKIIHVQDGQEGQEIVNWDPSAGTGDTGVVMVQSAGCPVHDTQVTHVEYTTEQPPPTTQSIMDDAFGFGQMDEGEIHPEQQPQKPRTANDVLHVPEVMHVIPLSSPMKDTSTVVQTSAPRYSVFVSESLRGRNSASVQEEMNKTYCFECHVTFANRQQLDEHVVETHLPEWHQCTKCKRVFVRLVNLRRHMQFCSGQGHVQE